MKDRWKGLVVGGLTGVVAGVGDVASCGPPGLWGRRVAPCQ